MFKIHNPLISQQTTALDASCLKSAQLEICTKNAAVPLVLNLGLRMTESRLLYKRTSLAAWEACYVPARAKLSNESVPRFYQINLWSRV
jgi:hypothetical protein